MDELDSVLGMPQRLVNFLYSTLGADSETVGMLEAAWSFFIIAMMAIGLAILHFRALVPYLDGIKYNDWRERKGTGWNLIFAVIFINAWFVMDQIVTFVFWLTD